jgi:release factor glutamine methyltransferase
MLLLLSSDTNIALLKAWALEAGFSWQQVAAKSIWVESFVVFRLTLHPAGTGSHPSPSDSAQVAAV